MKNLSVSLVNVFRYSVNSKINDNKLLFILSVTTFFFIDTTLSISNINFTSVYTCLDDISLFVIPSLSKNILLTYLSIKTNYKTTILYRLVMELPVYLIPIVPDLGVYLKAVCEFSLYLEIDYLKS